MTINGGSEAIFLQQLFPEDIVKILPPVLAPYPDINRVVEPGEYTLSLEVRVETEEE